MEFEARETMSQAAQRDQQDEPGGPGAQPADAVRVEADRPPVRKLAVVLLALTLFVVGSVVGVGELFKVMSDRKIQATNLGVENDLLGELRARDREAATTWGVLDAEKGRYRMPVDRAVERLLANPKRIGPLAEPPRPAPAVAPGGGGR